MISRENLTYEVKDILFQVQYKGNLGRDRLAKKIVNAVMDKVEAYGGTNVNIDMKTEARARGVSEDSIKMSERIGKAFGFDVMPLTPAACEVYEWVAEQEANGQKIETFAAWAKNIDRLEYIRKYRKDAGNIKIDWPLAFVSAITVPQQKWSIT